MKRVSVFSDGSCKGNPGPGGWAALLVYMDHHGRRRERELSGYEPHTTNNRMELCAAIRGLDALREPCQVDFYTDSRYVLTMAGGGQAKRNGDLVEQLRAALHRHEVILHHVNGHSGHPENERVDCLARQQAEQAKLARSIH